MSGGFDLLSGSEPPLRINGGNDASNEDTRVQVITWQTNRYVVLARGRRKETCWVFPSASEGESQNMPKKAPGRAAISLPGC